MIRFEHVSKAYLGGRQALQGVTFHMQPGEMAFLTGQSGAGKSTLLKLICGIERPSAGKIYFSGHDISRLKNREVPFLRRQIGMIFQDHHLLMDRTVFDNVAIPLIIAGASFGQGAGAVDFVAAASLNVLLGRVNAKGGMTVLPAAAKAIASAVGRESAKDAGEKVIVASEAKVVEYIGKVDELLKMIEDVKKHGVVTVSGGGAAAGGEAAGGSGEPEVGGAPSSDFGFGSDAFATDKW